MPLRLARALDFQDPAKVRESLPPIVKRFAGPEEKTKAVLPAVAAGPAFASRRESRFCAGF